MTRTATTSDQRKPRPGPSGVIVVCLLIVILMLWAAWSGDGRNAEGLNRQQRESIVAKYGEPPRGIGYLEWTRINDEAMHRSDEWWEAQTLEHPVYPRD